ncbi:MAG: hypothetical protein ACFHVJ_15035 [Aestuariibacter sp.]
MKKLVVLFICGLLSFSGSVFGAGDAKHFPGIFIGYTDTEDETEFTFGFEYEYKFTSEWGIGAVYERLNDAHDGDGIDITLGSLYYHPQPQIRLGLGYGEEDIGGTKPKTKDVVRLSAAYDFHVGDFGIAPTFAVDFIDGDKAYVLGVAIIRPF